MIIECDYEIGQIVFLKTDPEQRERMITSVQFTGVGLLIRVVHGTEETWHYPVEISTECNMSKKLNLPD